jgi:hypothetical protein
VGSRQHEPIEHTRFLSLHALCFKKTVGAFGLLAGFALPSVGIAAGIGLILFFAGTIIFTLRARWYSHLLYPTMWFLLAVGSLVLRMTSA